MGSTPRAVEANRIAKLRREWDTAMRSGTPVSLTPTEVDLEEHPLTQSRRPLPVIAWVRYGTTPVRVKGFTSMWTDMAAKVRWTVPQGGWHEAWVWFGAYEARRLAPGESPTQTFGPSVNSADLPDFEPAERRARGLGDR